MKLQIRIYFLALNYYNEHLSVVYLMSKWTVTILNSGGMSTCQCPNNRKLQIHVLRLIIYMLHCRLLNTLPIFTTTTSTNEVLMSVELGMLALLSSLLSSQPWQLVADSQMKSDYFRIGSALHCTASSQHHHHPPLISSWMCFISCFISKQSCGSYSLSVGHGAIRVCGFPGCYWV